MQKKLFELSHRGTTQKVFIVKIPKNERKKSKISSSRAASRHMRRAACSGMSRH